mmetsp:Transcript_15357/g.28615  ORF Transcript_15357/g.28615 Transcript_15357/m.28615 type:complete len:293 (-) Transcript_15357:105-983(-)|eukprot:CAMPEP_0178763710 /NCGR_PEP_ID=MMETSP0744-20121128/17340_1 /TAXON_ID=913974 /ORGANISM="Nitzschia punctata, Strain CCMP561" /LENGTH=292 /DNA_ID=CAMNT_0020418711 /DNA_START=68 /DNA_END=946 /DNA_ORIENTATION=+
MISVANFSSVQVPISSKLLSPHSRDSSSLPNHFGPYYASPAASTRKPVLTSRRGCTVPAQSRRRRPRKFRNGNKHNGTVNQMMHKGPSTSPKHMIKNKAKNNYYLPRHLGRDHEFASSPRSFDFQYPQNPTQSHVPYVPQSPSFCDTVPQADYSRFIMSGRRAAVPPNHPDPYRSEESFSQPSTDHSLVSSEHEQDVRNTFQDDAFSEKMAELRKAYKRFAAKHFSREKNYEKKGKKRKRSPVAEKMSKHGDNDLGCRLSYDPCQPQYSPTYNPDPFRNEREYSPNYPDWLD